MGCVVNTYILSDKILATDQMPVQLCSPQCVFTFAKWALSLSVNMYAYTNYCLYDNLSYSFLNYKTKTKEKLIFKQ